MLLSHSDDISIALTSFFMKACGIWMATNYIEKQCRNIAIAYTIFVMIFQGSIQVLQLYYSREDFSIFLYDLCNFLSLVLPMFKTLVLFAHRKDLFQLVVHLERKFLHGNYNVYEKMILDECKSSCAYFVCIFTSFVHVTILAYIISPIAANLGVNRTERELPYKVSLEFTYLTPYFEILFVLELVFLYHVGLCYMSMDNILCILNLHVACQFRILQHRLENLQSEIKEMFIENWKPYSARSEDECYAMFRSCVLQHQELIAYCGKLEKVFSLCSLGQVLVFSTLICLDAYQIALAQIPIATRSIYVFHIIHCILQLFMFTYSCDCLIQDSTKVAVAMYGAPWTHLSMNKNGKMLRKDLKLVILRSRTPCCVTAHGFFPVSLETFTKIVSTAMSYFTLLQGQAVNAT